VGVNQRRLAKPEQSSLLLVNIAQLLTLRSSKAGPRRGADLGELGIIEDAAVLCQAGKIVAVGKTRQALRDPWYRKNQKTVREIDCRGMVVLPGFIDSHTHPVFVAPRLVDFEKRAAGATYREIAEAGGGIRSSVAAVRRASKSTLTEKVLAAFNEMADHGTTTIEAKSGYGLSTVSEIKSLEAIRAAAEQWPGRIVPTLLGAHVVPDEFKANPDDYVREVCETMIPTAAQTKLAEFVDVFCDQGAFTPQQSARVFAAAEQHGLPVRAHMCQLSATDLQPFLRFRPASFDHMDHLDPADVAPLAQSDTIASLVPGANYFLGHPYPDARQLISAGVAVALATDYNPGSSPTPSMPFILSLACTQMKMSPAEAISAATLNGSCALRLADTKGSIEPGKDADLAAFRVTDYREIAYWFAVNHCAFTILNGNLRQTYVPSVG
jgi:imidazolonepropionase